MVVPLLMDSCLSCGIRLLSCPFPSSCFSSERKAFSLLPGGLRSVVSHPAFPVFPFLPSLLFLLLLNPACSFRPSEHIALLFTAFCSSLAFAHIYVWALFWLQTPFPLYYRYQETEFPLLTLYMIGIQLIDENISFSI